ncbi:GAF domain protein [Verrucomicrobia bacterium]|nr:GAF domain protein [Verrucomicrobiota bacterium]
MNGTRLNILPDPSFRDLRPMLCERLGRIGTGIYAEQFGALLDTLMRETLGQGFAAAGAHEGTVWLLDEASEHLVPAYNTGPQADRLVGKFKQPLNAGLICMVFASEQPFVENEVWKNSQQSKLLDTALEKQTCAMIAVPFHFLGACRGVVSCVQLKQRGSTEPDPPGFRAEHLASVHRAALVLARLIEYRLLGWTVGWSCE